MAQEMNTESTMFLKRAIALVAEAMDLVDARGDCPAAAAHLDVALRLLREQATQQS